MTVRGQVWLDVPTVGGVSGIVLWFVGEYKRSPGAVGGLVHRTHDGIYTWRRGKKKKKKRKKGYSHKQTHHGLRGTGAVTREKEPSALGCGRRRERPTIRDLYKKSQFEYNLAIFNPTVYGIIFLAGSRFLHLGLETMTTRNCPLWSQQFHPSNLHGSSRTRGQLLHVRRRTSRSQWLTCQRTFIVCSRTFPHIDLCVHIAFYARRHDGGEVARGV